MTGFIVSVLPFRNRVSLLEAFEGLELGEGKPSRPVLRGPGGRKAAWLLGSCVSFLGTDSARLVGSGLRIPTMKILGGNKGALRIPSLSFQLLRRPGCTAKLLCFQ